MVEPKFVYASKQFIEALRKESRRVGVRHRLVDHWIYDLGWTFAPGVREKYLEPELLNG